MTRRGHSIERICNSQNRSFYRLTRGEPEFNLKLVVELGRWVSQFLSRFR